MAFTVTARHGGGTGAPSTATYAPPAATPTASSMLLLFQSATADAVFSPTVFSFQTPTGGSLTYSNITKIGESAAIPWGTTPAYPEFFVGGAAWRADVGASPVSFSPTVDPFSGTQLAFQAAASVNITGHDTTTPIVQSKTNGASKNAGAADTGFVTLDTVPTAGNLIVVYFGVSDDNNAGIAAPTAGVGKTFTAAYSGTTATHQAGLWYRIADGTESATITSADLGDAVGNYVAIAVEVKLAGSGTDGSVTAVAATASSLALPPVVTSTGDANVTAVAATATALALAPVVTGTGDALVVATLATATADALAPTATGTGSATVVAVVATGAAQAEAPAVSGDTTLTGGGPATATADAIAPTITATANPTVSAVAATATADAAAPVVTAETFDSPTVVAVAATATADAIAPAVAATANPTVDAVAATATADAIAPAVTATAEATVLAVAATSDASAPAPVVTGETIGSPTVLAVAATSDASAPAPSILGQQNATIQALVALANAQAQVPVVHAGPDVTPTGRDLTITATLERRCIAAELDPTRYSTTLEA